MLNHMGICVSIRTTRKIADEALNDSDVVVKTWKKVKILRCFLIKQCMAFKNNLYFLCF